MNTTVQPAKTINPLPYEKFELASNPGLKHASGTMTLTSVSAVAIWNCELAGQLSDGMWENTAPHDHWEFWCNLQVSHGTENAVKMVEGHTCRKNSYNFAGLYEVIGDRMLAIGRMGRAAVVYEAFEALCEVAEHMPATFEEFKALKAGFTTRDYSSVTASTKLQMVSDACAKRFYATVYTMKDLRDDIRLIKATLKSVPTSRY